MLVGITSFLHDMSCTTRIPQDLASILSKRTMLSIFKARDFKDVPQVGFLADLY